MDKTSDCKSPNEKWSVRFYERKQRYKSDLRKVRKYSSCNFEFE